MSRLIDADELLAQIRQIDFLKIPNITKLSACEIMEIVNNQPTAYNVDKVVAELEEESDYEPIDYDYCDMSCSGEEHFIVTDKAIDIVRKGGVE